MAVTKFSRYDRLVIRAISQWLDDHEMTLDWGIERMQVEGSFDLGPAARGTWQSVRAFVLLRETCPMGGRGQTERKFVEVKVMFHHNHDNDFQTNVEDYKGQLGGVG